MSHSKDRLAPPSEVLLISEAAAFMRVSTRTIHRWTDAGLLRVYRLKGTKGTNNRRYLRSELLALLEPEDGRREPPAHGIPARPTT
jgi:excisionase family DNA binding protein